QVVHRRPAVAPFVGAATVLAFIFIYTGSHALLFHTWNAELAPLAAGGALLSTIFLYTSGRAQALVSLVVGPLQRVMHAHGRAMKAAAAMRAEKPARSGRPVRPPGKAMKTGVVRASSGMAMQWTPNVVRGRYRFGLETILRANVASNGVRTAPRWNPPNGF